MADQLTVTTERIDDVVILLHMMMQMGLPEGKRNRSLVCDQFVKKLLKFARK